MQANQYEYLKFVRFRDFFQWDLKRYFNQSIHSKFQIFNLGTLISEEKDKFDVSDPKTDYGILGVNNQTGIFDAYIENGSKIKQKYKKMKVGWIAYNPYRVNVGSVGIKRECHNNVYISPAYVVFSCKQSLDPEFLYMALKTPLFNRVIRENTTGSVRQNLSFEVLSTLPIPLPIMAEQQALVEAYNAKIKAAEENERRAEQLNNEIEDYLLDELGIKLKGTYSQNLPESSVCAEPQVEYCINPASSAMMKDTYHWGDEIKKEYRWLKFVRFKDVDRWDCYNAENKLKSIFGIVRLGELITSISTGTTPPTSIKTYFDGNVKFYTPADISDEMYLSASERYISDLAIKDNKARVFHRGDVLFVGIGSTVGKVGVVNDDIVSSNQQITGFSLKTSLVIPEYVFCFMNYNKHITTAEKTKSTLPIVNQEKIINIPIPIPPLEIQNAIVKHITELKEQIKQLKQEAKELRENALVEFEKEIFEN